MQSGEVKQMPTDFLTSEKPASELGVSGNPLKLRPWHWRDQKGWCQPFNCFVSREGQVLSSWCYVTVSVIRVPSAGRCLWSKASVGDFPGSMHKRKLEFANSMNLLGFRLAREWWPEMVFFLTFLLCVRGRDERPVAPVSSRNHLTSQYALNSRDLRHLPQILLSWESQLLHNVAMEILISDFWLILSFWTGWAYFLLVSGRYHNLPITQEGREIAHLNG